jgi:VWFA-related protein
MRSILAALLLVPALAFAQQQPSMKSGETITVERILVDARVTDYNGDPLLGLKPADFKVKIDGVDAVVESAEWIPENAVARDLSGLDDEPQKAVVNESLDIPPPNGRLLIFFFQTDFARAHERIVGQMHLLATVDQLIDSLEEDDRVAVFSFDSHLKFRLDFMSDKRRIRDAMEQALLINEPAAPPMVPMPSLAKRLDKKELFDVKSPERALLVVANALRPIPGPKSLILFGWGLGHLVGKRVTMGPDYGAARIALESARVTVFSLDTTYADSHTLEVGLAKAADDTGGFYAKTNEFPSIAYERLQRTLAGHYELEVRKPPTSNRGAVHAIDVQVERKGVYVMARSSYADK